MRNRIKTLWLVLLLVIVRLTGMAQAPVINSFSPLTASVGTEVIIKGQHFDAVADSNTVYFGTARATVTAATDTSISVTVPAGSVYAPINVQVDTFITGSKLPFITTFGNGNALLNASYGMPSLVAYAQFPAIGDFDNDGHLDMASVIAGNKILLYRAVDSSGVSVFRPGPQYTCVSNPAQVITADFNADGKLDIVVAGGGSISIFKNTSSNSNLQFRDLGFFSFSSSVNIFSITAGDVDGDGKTDLAVGYDHSGTCFTVARNIGRGDTIAFGARTSYAFGSVPGGSGNVGDGCKIVLADVDGDGKLDVTAVSRFFPPYLVYRNTSVPGTVSFAAKVAITSNRNNTIGNGFYDMKLADIDGDNKPEIMFVSNDSLQFIYYRNLSSQGNISFGSKESLPVSGYPVFIAVNDMNGDGKADVTLMAGGSAAIFQNTSEPGSISFKPKKEYPAQGLETLAVADMDADGKPDILVSGNFYSTIVPYTTYLLKNAMGNNAPVSLCTLDSTATIESDIEGNTYQWQANTGNGFEDITNDTVYAGVNTPVLQLSNISSAWAGTSYRCLVDGRYSTEQFLRFTAIFYGGSSSLWEDRLNWSCGQLPGPNTDVIIWGIGRNVYINSNVIIRTITLSNKATLLVKAPRVLLVTH